MKINGKELRDEGGKDTVVVCVFGEYMSLSVSGGGNEGVSIQTIRDYLGHNNENMTKQYIDYMPKRIEQANKEYFNQAENLLATGIIPKKRGEKTGK